MLDVGTASSASRSARRFPWPTGLPLSCARCGRNDGHHNGLGHKSVHGLPERSKRTRWLSARLTITTVTVGLVVGCSVTDYKEPISELQTAIEMSIDTVNVLDTKATATINERWRDGIVKGDFLLATSDDQCATHKSACTLKIEFRDKQEKPKPYPAITLIPEAKAGLAALRNYVENLRSIVEADTVGKVKSAANSALGSAQNLRDAIAKTKEEESNKSVAGFTEPLVAAIGWIVGQYVDYVKYRALAESTRQADPVIADLESLYSSIGDAFTGQEQADALKAFLSVQDKFDDAANQGELNPEIVDDYVAAAAVYHIRLGASTATPFQAFVKTHAKLTQQLNRKGGVTLADATAAIAELHDRAKAFKAVVEGFTKKTGKSKETPDAIN